MYAFGQFDNVAFRVFDKEDCAESFLHGKLRFGLLAYYTVTESQERLDREEGVSRFLIDSVTNTGTYISNHVYVLSFHRTLDSALNSRYGSYIVEVRDPRKLAELATLKMKETPDQFIGGIEGVFVDYNKGEEFYVYPKQLELARLIYSQKPRYPHERDNEFRLVILSKKYQGEHFELDLNMGFNFAKKLEVKEGVSSSNSTGSPHRAQ